MNFMNALMTKMVNFLGGYSDAIDGIKGTDDDKEWIEMMKTLVKIIDQFLPVAIILVGMVGAIYCIVMGVKYAKSESSEEKDAVKKKLINAAIGIVIGLIIMIALTVFLKNATAVKEWIESQGNQSLISS